MSQRRTDNANRTAQARRGHTHITLPTEAFTYFRVAKRVVLGMNSWQTRVLSSKKEVTQSVLSSLFLPIAMEVTPDDEARPPRPCVRCVTLSIERASEFA